MIQSTLLNHVHVQPILKNYSFRNINICTNSENIKCYVGTAVSTHGRPGQLFLFSLVESARLNRRGHFSSDDDIYDQHYYTINLIAWRSTKRQTENWPRECRRARGLQCGRHIKTAIKTTPRAVIKYKSPRYQIYLRKESKEKIEERKNLKLKLQEAKIIK